MLAHLPGLFIARSAQPLLAVATVEPRDARWQAGHEKSFALVCAGVGRAGGLSQPTRSLQKELDARPPKLGPQAPVAAKPMNASQAWTGTAS